MQNELTADRADVRVRRNLLKLADTRAHTHTYTHLQVSTLLFSVAHIHTHTPHTLVPRYNVLEPVRMALPLAVLGVYEPASQLGFINQLWRRDALCKTQ